MEIKASCVYDFKAVKSLTHASIYKKTKPSKLIIWLLVLVIILIALSIFCIITADTPEEASTFYYSCGSFVVCFLVFLYLHFFFPKIQYKRLSQFKDIENQYLFTDTGISQISTNSNYDGTSQIDYSMIFKVMETSEYLFVFINKMQAWVVDKSTIENGNVEDIRNLLKGYLGRKYIICNY